MSTRVNLFIILATLAILSLGCSFFYGTTVISGSQIWQVLSGNTHDTTYDILFSVRLPRTLCAFVVGGLLALAGSLMQVLLRNPLADPYVLGISGGAALGTLLLLFFEIHVVNSMTGAWLGSLLAMALVFFFTRNNLTWNSHKILLTGIALASGFSALISFILLLSPEKELRSMLFWLIGDLSYSRMPVFEFFILMMGLVISMGLASKLNILVRGEIEAQALGVNTKKLHITLYIISSILTAAAVALAGAIGFIGLIIPHMLRLLGFHNHFILLPTSVLLGGSFLTITDTLARTLWSPQQLPVGILMSLIGIPIFLILLRKNPV